MAYPPKALANALELEARFQGHMHTPTRAATYPPLRMLMKRGNKAVRSHPAVMELAEMLVPSWAMMKPMAMKAEAARVPDDWSSAMKLRRIVNGDQTKAPKRVYVEEAIKIPIKEVTENRTGRAINWGRITEEVLSAREAIDHCVGG